MYKEFGKGFMVTNLKYMRQFYRAFPIRQTVCGELSWLHYRMIYVIMFLVVIMKKILKYVIIVIAIMGLVVLGINFYVIISTNNQIL